jgi:hypothetical protein
MSRWINLAFGRRQGQPRRHCFRPTADVPYPPPRTGTGEIDVLIGFLDYREV